MASRASFLADLAATLYAQHKSRLAQLTVVLPNWRAGGVLKKCLAAHLRQPAWAPQVMSIDRFLQQHSPLRQAQPLLLTHALYQTFQALQAQEEPFEQFYQWGHLLLQDLDVIDKYLVRAAHLFTDLRQQKELSFSLDYLTEAQRAAIQAFWKSFEQRLSAHQEDFLRLWRLLPQVYQAFRQRLQAQGIGYQGLCYRTAYEALAQGKAQIQHQYLVFAGFNALTPVEEGVLTWCQANLSTAFYWDVDAYYMEDVQQEAGMYLRAYRQRPHLRASFVQPFPQRLVDVDKEVHVTAVASEVGQAQVVGAQLQALMATQGAAFVPSKTAIVVANEALLLPVLHALPLEASQVSVTLGYPLKDTALYRLLEHLLALQVAASQANSPQGYLATRHVRAVLEHPHVLAWSPDVAKATLNSFKDTASLYVARATLVQAHDWYAVLFKALSPTDSLLVYLIEVLRRFQEWVKEADTCLRPLEAKALQHLLRQLDGLRALLTAPAVSGEAFVQLFRQLVRPAKLSLGHQESEGLQVLDVLATQNLDFDQVFIVGMNEGYFPAQGSPSSFVPYNLRKGYGLPTADQHQAALYAYLFYRLLQRAQKVYITYSTAASGSSPGEMSRYLWQLLYEAKLPLKKQVLAQPIYLSTAQPIVVSKKGRVRQQLEQFVLRPDGTAQPFSPSALNTYLDCSLRFYFQYLAQLKASPPPQQATHALGFGRLLHEVMERLYAPLMRKGQGQPLQFQDLATLQKTVGATIQAVFARAFHAGQRQPVGASGDQAVAQAVMHKLVTRIVALDQAYAPFVLTGLELGRQPPLVLDFMLGPTKRVRLRGIIDRVDWKAGVFRVLDYKTGLDSKQLKGIAALFDREDRGRNKAAFQAFFYAWLFQQRGLLHVAATVPQACGSAVPQVMPGLLNTRQVFDDNFDPRFFLQSSGSRTYVPIEDIALYQAEWEQGLRSILTELLDVAVPFVQTEDKSRCTSCPYQGICQRH